MITQENRTSLLQNADGMPLYEEQMVCELGRTMVIAPQPDAESLGCGGLLALLRKHKQACQVTFLGDGSASHPNSASFPPSVLKKLRRYEALMALQELGLSKDNALFMNLVDGSLPRTDSEGFERTVSELCDHMHEFLPDTIIVPWRRDPNSDYQAGYHLALAAIEGLEYYPRVLEYPVWSRIDATSTDDAPHPGEMIAWRVNTSSVQDIKLRAISAHGSQVGNLVDDDPQGFHLHPHMLKPFLLPYDVFLESYNDDKPISTR